MEVLKGKFLSMGSRPITDSRTGEVVQLREVNYLPFDDDNAPVNDPQVLYSTLDLPSMVPGRVYDFMFTDSRKGDHLKLIGILPSGAVSADVVPAEAVS